MKNLKNIFLACAVLMGSSLAFSGNFIESDTFANGNVKYTIEKVTEDADLVYYLYKEYYQDGTLKETGMYNTFGDKTGKWVAYYGNGNVASELEYLEGLKNGTQISYTEDGVKQICGEYKYDKKHGVFKQYSADGSMLTSQRIYRNGRLKESYAWDESEGLLIVKK